MILPDVGSVSEQTPAHRDRSSNDVQCSAQALALLRQTERELLPRLSGVLDYLSELPRELGATAHPEVESYSGEAFARSFGEASEQTVAEVAAAFTLITERVASGTIEYYCLPGDFEFGNGWRCESDGVRGHTFRELEFVDLCPGAFVRDSAYGLDSLAMTIVHELSHQNRNSIRGTGTTDGLPRLRPDYAYSYDRLLRKWYPSLPAGGSAD